MKKIKLLVILLAFSLLTVACGQGANSGSNTKDEAQSNQEGKISVQTSFFVLEDFARKIGGDKAEVGTIISNGQALHGWEPSPKDISKLQESDLFIYNGAGLETWVDKVLDGIDHDQVLSIEASKGVELMKGDGHDHDNEGQAVEEDHDHDNEEGMDPHVWTSPKNAIILAENIYKGLSEKDPENRDYYEKNFKTLKEDLINLDKEYTDVLSDAEIRDIVVSHEAYGYMAKEYGLNQVPIEGINSNSEPDPKTMQKIIEFMRDKNVKTVFTEPLIDPKVAETIAKETGAEVAILDPLEGLPEGKDLSTTSYIELMEDNLKALEKALIK